MEIIGLSCPVTAVRMLLGPPHVVAAAYNRRLRLYSVDTVNSNSHFLCAETAVFPDTSRIHRIKPITQRETEDHRMLCFGGKRLAVVCYRHSRSGRTITDRSDSAAAPQGAGPATSAANCSKDGPVDMTEHRIFVEWVSPTLDDLILDAVGITTPADEPETIAQLLAHNQVEVWRVGDTQPLCRIQGTEQCILYSGNLFGSTIESLVAVVGTVFSIALIWRPFGKTTDATCSFKGHQGAIFSARFNADDSLLATASDDRSVRVWEVPTAAFADGAAGSVVPLVVSKAKFVLYSHTSRVWDAAFLGEHLVSTGEDAVCCVWSMADGRLLKRCIGHEGKNVWALHSVVELGSVVCTGGADGAVRLWSTADVDRVGVETAATVPPEILGSPDDFPRLVALLSLQSCVICTNNGDIIRHDRLGEKQPEFTVLDRALGPGSRRVTCFTALQGRHAIACAGSPDGLVTMVSVGGTFPTVQWSAHDGPLQNLFLIAMDDLDDFSDATGSLCVFSVAPGLLKWWVVCGCGTTSPTVHAIACFRLDPTVSPSQSYVQALLWCKEDSALWIGDRTGTLTCFPALLTVLPSAYPLLGAPEAITKTRVADPLMPLATFPKIHGNKKSITYLSLLPENVLRTAGRDGYFREFILGWDAEHKVPTLHPISKTKASPKMDWIVELVGEGDSSQPIALGFEKDSFVAIDTSSGEELCHTICGGGHRSWDFMHEGDSVTLRTFVYLRDKAIRSTVVAEPTGLQRLRLPQVVQSPFSGREVLCAVHIPTVHGDFLVTGGEDCQARISSCSSSLAHNKQCTVISQAGCPAHGHTSSIRCMISALLPVSGRPETVIFTGGGNALLKCWLAVHHGNGLRLQRLSEWPPHGGAEDYRMMEIVLVRRSSPSLFVACSDGAIRTFSVGIDDFKLTLVATANFHERCVLSLVSAVSLGRTLLFSGATDGQVVVWNLGPIGTHDIPLLETPIATMDLHQSGVNAIAVAGVETAAGGDSTLLVVTAGDDNAITIGLCHCVIGDAFKFSQVSLCTVASSHASSVTGLALISPLSFVTVSADCRLNVWKVAAQSAKEKTFVKCDLTESILMEIDDPQAAIVLQQPDDDDGLHIVAIGCGVEHFRYKPQS
eukprot:m.465683 g.465683  ORF g.465683 m.465683 type:complete len:1120 (+) comp24473_c0_seq1:199-3558(+)